MDKSAAQTILRFFRFVIARKQLRNLKKKSVKREHILKEVLKTEKDYLDNLQVLSGVCYLNCSFHQHFT